MVVLMIKTKPPLLDKQLFGVKYWNFQSPACASALHNLIQFMLVYMYIYLINPIQYSSFISSFSFFNWKQSGYLWYTLPTAIGAAADVALSNTSLRYISIPAYIMVKNSTPIFVLISSWALGLERITIRLVIIILIILTGVCLAIQGEIAYTPKGMMLVLIASSFSGLRWALTQRLMIWHRKNGIVKNTGALITMYTLTPFISLFLGLTSVLIEPTDPRIMQGDLMLVLIILLGGGLAFTMVISEFLLIQGSSVIALSIAGIAKEIVLISASMLVFGDVLSFQNLLGLFISILGIIWFNKYRNSQKGTHVDYNLPSYQMIDRPNT